MKNSCSGQIVRAHTVSRAASLSKIARSSHVYQLSLNLYSPDEQGLFTYKLEGINRASTFSGFCGVHDGDIFKPIDGNFLGSAEQCFLLAYRALSRELFTKSSASDLLSNSGDLDSGRDVSQQFNIQRFFSGLETGMSLGLRDVKSHKSAFDQMLTERDFSPLRYYIVDLQSPPEIMGACGFFPIYDFSGHQVQEIADPNKISDAIFYSSIASGEQGAVVFSWHEDSDSACIPFVLSLDKFSNDELPHALVRMFFDTPENFYLSPDWYESLQERDRQALVHRIKNWGDPTEPINRRSLLDDGIRAVDWLVIGRRTNIEENRA